MLKRISTPEALVASAEDKKSRSSHGAGAQASGRRERPYLLAPLARRTRSLGRPNVAAASAFAGGEAGAERCKYLQRRSAPRLRSRSSGFSLIEVVIALGVFLFGALAIVRIFPGALGVIQTSERRNVAQRMNQTSLARYTTAPLSVPEAIVDVDPANYNATTNETGWNDFAGSVYGTATRNESLPRNPPAPDDISFDNSSAVATQFTNSAAGRFRRIIGEEHIVNREIVSGVAQGVITLRYPFVNPTTPAAIVAVHQPLLYETFAINGVTVNSAGEMDFSDATSAETGSSVSDAPTNPQRPLSATGSSLRMTGATAPAREAVTFYISYRYFETGSTGSTSAVVDEPKRFPSDAGWNADAPRCLMASVGRTVVPGSIQVKVRRLASIAILSPDVERNLGRVIVDVSLAGNGKRYSMDYSVPDWRMIVHDDNLSTTLSTSDQDYLDDQDPAYTFGAGGTVRNARVTTVPPKFITEDAVSTNPTLVDRPAQTYAMIRGIGLTGTVTSTSAAWSPDKFSTPSRISYSIPPAATDGRALGLRPKTGQVFFDVNNLVAPSGRVVFRNVDGWLEQPSVAARSYVRYVDRSTLATTADRRWWPREHWREYVWNTNDDALYFHPSETGKTVLATYQYQVGSGATAVVTTMRDVPLTVRENLVPQSNDAVFNGFALNPNAGAATQASRAYFVDNAGRCIGITAAVDTDVVARDPVGAPPSARVIAIQSIKGASIRVRSAWFDGGRYSQNDVSGYRSLDVESNSRS